MFSMRRLTGNLSEIASRIRQGRIKQIRTDPAHDFPAMRDNSLYYACATCLVPTDIGGQLCGCLFQAMTVEQ